MAKNALGKNPRVPLAERYFALHRRLEGVEHDLICAMIVVMGEEPNGTWNLPFDDIEFDDYDSSFELTGMSDDNFCLTPEQNRALKELGFDRYWFRYISGKEDTHVCLDTISIGSFGESPQQETER
jgi:hypothetical protein